MVARARCVYLPAYLRQSHSVGGGKFALYSYYPVSWPHQSLCSSPENGALGVSAVALCRSYRASLLPDA